MKLRNLFRSITLCLGILTCIGCYSCGGGGDTSSSGGIWTNPAGITDNISPDGQYASGPQVAMDDNGNAIIVWSQSNGTNDQIFKSEYRSGTWTHPTSLTDNISPDGQDARSPQVAMDNNGNVIVVWQQSDGTKLQIFKSEYRGGVWTHPASLAVNISPDGQSATGPYVAMDNNGNAIIVWQQNDGAKDQIYKSEYRGSAWTHPISLADNISPDGQHAVGPRVAMDDNENVIIVWYQSDGTRIHIFKSEYRGGAWSSPISITNNTSEDACGPQPSMDNNGNAIIIWQQYDLAHQEISKSEYRGGVWTNPAYLAELTGYFSVAMGDNEDAIIAWCQSDGTDDQIFKSEYRGGAWTNPVGLTDNISPDGFNASEVQTDMDNDGSVIIVWSQSNGTNNQIFKSEYRSGVWIHPTSLAHDNISPNEQNAVGPRVAMDNNGNAIIVWCQSDGTTQQIFKSEYR
jgi:hypothetical protein